MKLIYDILSTLLVPFALVRLVWKSRKQLAYRQRIGERLSLQMPHNPQRPLWIHTVSVGEFLATAPLIEALLSQGETLLVTCTTPTGSAMVQEKLGDRVRHQYLPLDAPFLSARFIKHHNPRIAIFVETEIWPNYLTVLERQSIPSLLINARLSQRSYEKYQKIAAFTTQIVKKFSLVACQNEASHTRFTRLGAHAIITGNIKFDLKAPANLAAQQQEHQRALNARAFILVASTHKNEEALILQAFQDSAEKRLLVIAPRHPERSDDVIADAQARGLSAYKYSQMPVQHDADVIVIDALGMLLPLYALADYAIIGGSYVSHGGHNPLEAALFATPCIIGTHYHNFESLVDEMLNEQAIEVVPHDRLFSAVPEISMGERAQHYLTKNQGALERYCELIHTTKAH